MLHRRQVFLALLVGLGPGGALAGAPPRVEVPEGAWLRLFDLGPKDAWYPHRERLIDQVCRVGPGPLRPHKATWFDGKMTCEDGLPYVFRQATFQALTASDADATDCPVGAWTGGPLGHDTEVRVVDVRSSDAFHGIRHEVVGLSGRVSGGLHDNGSGSCWLGGSFVSADGRDWYFYEAAFAVDRYVPPERHASTPPVDAGSCPEGAYTGATLHEDSRVTLLSVHPDDAYHDIRQDFEGRSGTVSGDLHNNGGCWYGGGFLRDDGTYAYFYKVALRVLSSIPEPAPETCAPGAATDAVVPKGHRVKIIDVHPDDAYYGTRYGIIGRAGTASEALELIEGCWYAGPVLGEDGEDWYFFKASLVDQGLPQ